MPNCVGITTNYSRCSHRPREGHTTCRYHTNQEGNNINELEDEIREMHNDQLQRDDIVDIMHYRFVQRDITDNMFMYIVRNFDLIVFEQREYAPNLRMYRERQRQRAIDFLARAERQARERHERAIVIDDTEEEVVQRVDNRGELEQIAEDPQSVHTTPVTNQTNSNVDKLLSVDVPENINTILELKKEWEQIYGKKVERAITDDMRRWYKRSLCRQEDDWLYKRILDGAWTLIKQSKFKMELTKRLYEEVNESLYMCCEGHISRLCNVFVGFDDTFKVEIPVNEILSSKIFKIYQMNVSVEEKALEAWKVMDELKIPESERMTWIEAL